ncbi:DgyrCDS10047 [Dimorphilus gyrociliatus]|uniref:Innexin n=1 Tax=Dimorphilus gyrociliatus TaxID=2664684 RepID=A0A7I8VZ44_9ANNE|nr:DgyrCDS10047 [Dimorphilus gyrociliatus]
MDRLLSVFADLSDARIGGGDSFTDRPLWRVLNRHSGISVATVTDAAIDCQRQRDPENREKTLKYMVNHISRFLKEVSRKHMTTTCRSNAIGQLFLLNVFLGTDYNMYGIKVLKQIINKEPWNLSERFPRVTMCDFNIRVVGNVQSYLVQCTLPINLFNEKIFIVIWFWFVFLSSATAGSLFYVIIKCFCMKDHESYIKRRLIAIDKYHGKAASPESLKHFTNHYLRRDGCFIVRMVAKNTSDMISAELIAGLWDMYTRTRNSIFRFESYEADALSLKGDTLREDPAADIPEDVARKEYYDGESSTDQDLVKRKVTVPQEDTS